MSILYPLLAMFALTAFCAFRLAYLRLHAVRVGAIDPRFFRLYRDAEEPDELRVHTRHYINLLEAPVLFYVIVIVAYVTQLSGALPLVLAWAYVLVRYSHTYVHLTSNRVQLRFRLFATSWFVLIALWLVVFAAILLRQGTPA